METIKVGIIDDENSKVTQIMTYLLYYSDGTEKQNTKKPSNAKFEVFEVPLSPDMNDITDFVLDNGIEVLLIDYNLASYETMPYSGVDVARYIDGRMAQFPMFILTSYEDELYEKEVFDTYQIFDFERYMSEEKERAELHYKLIQQVIKHHKQLELWEKELQRLLPEKGKSAAIDSKILELDSLLEKSIDGHASISDTLKKSINQNKVDELIRKIDLLLEDE